ncbi:MAG TPA: hypothetical protein VK530_12875 [Candidatus Acidoferrum sp.]|nr:hypothetical protein [Candidatus Acidoferrum sp.]
MQAHIGVDETSFVRALMIELSGPISGGAPHVSVFSRIHASIVSIQGCAAQPRLFIPPLGLRSRNLVAQEHYRTARFFAE